MSTETPPPEVEPPTPPDDCVLAELPPVLGPPPLGREPPTELGADEPPLPILPPTLVPLPPLELALLFGELLQLTLASMAPIEPAKQITLKQFRILIRDKPLCGSRSPNGACHGLLEFPNGQTAQVYHEK